MTGRLTVNPARRSQPGEWQGWLGIAAALFAGVSVAVLVWAAAYAVDPTIGWPSAFYIGLATGTVVWPAAATPLAVGTVVVFAGLIGFGVVRSHRRKARASRVDSKAGSMARAGDLRTLLPVGAAADAERLGASSASDGVPIGRLLPGRQVLRSSWEWTQVWLMGPRAGKTSTVCVRQVAETNGPCLATSNKRDIVDMTRGLRSRLGTVWVFDPQTIVGEEARWWWNPLSYITGVAEAQEMAALFAAAGRSPEDRTDAYFDVEGQNYLASLLLAAATAEQPITQVLTWAARPGDNEPADVLAMAGYAGMSESLRSIILLADRQRDGVVGTARKSIAWLGNPELLPWITPLGPHDRRPQFDPRRFVESRQTLYVVSREGRGTARAVTAALTVATVTAAEKLASGSPRGRLAVPLAVVLDEAANIVRWPDLPDLYSHYGSRGIAVSTFLQSWNQGVEVWGRDGMEKLWSAANVRVIGSGLAQAQHLQDASVLIGDHDVVTHDVSVSPRSGGLFSSGRSTSTRLNRERIFETHELAALPRNRAVMLSAGAPAALIELIHYSETEYASDIDASESYYTGRAGAR